MTVLRHGNDETDAILNVQTLVKDKMLKYVGRLNKL